MSKRSRSTWGQRGVNATDFTGKDLKASGDGRPGFLNVDGPNKPLGIIMAVTIVALAIGLVAQ